MKTAISGYCERGGNVVVTSGMNSVTKVQKSYPGCAVTVFVSGTITKATIYSDSTGTSRGNPFTANSDGSWVFYVDNGLYDITFSGGGIPSPFTITHVSASDPYLRADLISSDPAKGTSEITYGAGTLKAFLDRKAIDIASLLSFKNDLGSSIGATLVKYGGVTVEDTLDALNIGQDGGFIAYPSLASLSVALNPVTPYTIRDAFLVTNDSTPANNGAYRITISGGVGTPVQSSFDRVAIVEARATVDEAAIVRLALPVTPQRTSFFDLSKNLANPADPDIVLGGYYDQTLTLISSVYVNQTGFVPVTAGLNYTAPNQDAYVLWFNIAKVLIGSTSMEDFTADGYAAAPTGAAYGRFVGYVSAWGTFQVEQANAPTSYVPYSALVKVANINQGGITAVADGAIKPISTTFFQFSRNICNPLDTDIVYGGYYDQSNVLQTDALFNMSGFIKVTAGLNYTTPLTGAIVLWFGSGKNLIGSTTATSFYANGYATAITNAAFGRFIGYVANWSAFQVEQADVATDYVPYASIKPNYLPATQSSSTLTGKKFTSFGDSITDYHAWQPYLVTLFGLIHTNCGIALTCLAGSTPDVTYPRFWEASRINAVKASDPDIITILGGANDHDQNILIGTDAQFALALGSKDKSTFKGAYSFIIETLLTWKPAVKIVPMTTMWLAGETTSGVGLTARDYAQATRDVAAWYGLPLVDLRASMGLNALTAALLTVDNVHPSDTGGKAMASLAADVFLRISHF